MAVYKPSFADAKILKYIPQNLIRRDLSRDFTKIMQAFPNVLWYKLPANIGIQSCDNSFNSKAGMGEGFVMAGIADDDISWMKSV